MKKDEIYYYYSVDDDLQLWVIRCGRDKVLFFDGLSFLFITRSEWMDYKRKNDIRNLRGIFTIDSSKIKELRSELFDEFYLLLEDDSIIEIYTAPNGSLITQQIRYIPSDSKVITPNGLNIYDSILESFKEAELYENIDIKKW